MKDIEMLQALKAKNPDCKKEIQDIIDRLTVPPGDVEDLIKIIRTLWGDRKIAEYILTHFRPIEPLPDNREDLGRRLYEVFSKGHRDSDKYDYYGTVGDWERLATYVAPHLATGLKPGDEVVA